MQQLAVSGAQQSQQKRSLFRGRTVDGGLRQNKDLIARTGRAVNLVIVVCLESGRCCAAAATPRVAAAGGRAAGSGVS